MSVVQDQAVVELLQAARALVAKGWCQGPFFKEIDGVRCFCALGAIRYPEGLASTLRTRTDAHDAAEAALDRAAERLTDGVEDAIDYNEASGRTKEEVLQLFDSALAEVSPPS